MVEDIIFNLNTNNDIIETNKKIQSYKEVNKEQILRGRMRPTKDALELEDIITEERKIRDRSNKDQAIQVKDDVCWMLNTYDGQPLRLGELMVGLCIYRILSLTAYYIVTQWCNCNMGWLMLLLRKNPEPAGK